MLSLDLGMMFLVANSGSISPSSDITCEAAIAKMSSCLPFSEGSNPPTPGFFRCSACHEVFHAANTTAIRRNLCECFKIAARDLHVNPDRARQIPQLCNLQGAPNIRIDPNFDCSM
ncbi:Lipid transfer protein/Par allergen [Parasponia andersonii]|uniref:Lipid transfer protein/Par allergen n=1 Tax=Parasponia andersonii TaxID=3476 RepID=A0A2P5BTP6_PARAD|nr:Lipid transfer protein/Par allergen [Parasponia andersonii]